MRHNPDDELKMAARLLTEMTGCEDSTALNLVDTIARYAVLKAQGCLPAGWGQRGS